MTHSDSEHPADVIGRLLVRVYEIHARVLEKGGGGIEGIRDAAMLHAAVARPFGSFAGVELYPSDCDKAAALFHSLIRRNFGCTHFIVGRDHAGVGGFYERYAGHRIFDGFAADELGVSPLRLHGPSYCDVCKEIVTEATCPHGPAGWVEVSGTEIRAMISRGERPPDSIMRPEIADFLIAKAREGRVFFEG